MLRGSAGGEQGEDFTSVERRGRGKVSSQGKERRDDPVCSRQEEKKGRERAHPKIKIKKEKKEHTSGVSDGRGGRGNQTPLSWPEKRRGRWLFAWTRIYIRSAGGRPDLLTRWFLRDQGKRERVCRLRSEGGGRKFPVGNGDGHSGLREEGPERSREKTTEERKPL